MFVRDVNQSINQSINQSTSDREGGGVEVLVTTCHNYFTYHKTNLRNETLKQIRIHSIYKSTNLDQTNNIKLCLYLSLKKNRLDESRDFLLHLIIVNRGEWFGSSANIKGANKDTKI